MEPDKCIRCLKERRIYATRFCSIECFNAFHKSMWEGEQHIIPEFYKDIKPKKKDKNDETIDPSVR